MTVVRAVPRLQTAIGAHIGHLVAEGDCRCQVFRLGQARFPQRQP